MSQRGSQKLGEIDPQQQMNSNQQNSVEYQTSLSTRIMIGYLYFIQGLLLSMPGTIPYIYPKLPDYLILSMFSLCVLPFSFKFLTAPILEKFSYVSYGKRKFWIVLSQTITILMIFIGSFFTNTSQAKYFAIILIFLFLGLSMQDISLDALCLKQLRNPKMMSTIQASCQSTGIILGGLILLKMTSLEFATKIGFNSPFATLQQMLIGLAIFLAIPTILIHLKFQQTAVQAQYKTTQRSLCEVYSIYRYFCKPNYRYFRTILFMVIYHQGFNCFLAGYPYQLIEHGFSRDTMNTIDNIENIIITLMIFMLGVYANVMGFAKTIMIYMTMMFFVLLGLWIWFPIDVISIIITNFIITFLQTWDFLVLTQLSANFPETGATGMLYTMSASMSNLGKNHAIHVALLKKIHWRTLSMIGLVIQIPMILFFVPKMQALIQSGQTKIEYSNQPQQNIQFAQNLQQIVQEKEDKDETIKN